jgi:hypothetical protein
MTERGEKYYAGKINGSLKTVTTLGRRHQRAKTAAKKMWAMPPAAAAGHHQISLMVLVEHESERRSRRTAVGRHKLETQSDLLSLFYASLMNSVYF